MRWLDDITASMDVNLGRLREIVRDSEAWSAAIDGFPKSRTCKVKDLPRTSFHFPSITWRGSIIPVFI